MKPLANGSARLSNNRLNPHPFPYLSPACVSLQRPQVQFPDSSASLSAIMPPSTSSAHSSIFRLQNHSFSNIHFPNLMLSENSAFTKVMRPSSELRQEHNVAPSFTIPLLYPLQVLSGELSSKYFFVSLKVHRYTDPQNLRYRIFGSP